MRPAIIIATVLFSAHRNVPSLPWLRAFDLESRFFVCRGRDS